MIEGDIASNRVELAPGYGISRLIKGGWQLAAGHSTAPVDGEAALADVFRYADGGITTFDCADIYTGVEELIGEFLRRYRQRRGIDARSELRVHTKFVPNLSDLRTIDRHDVERTIDRSLKRLGVERLDLVQFHWWDYDVPRYVEVAAHLAAFQQAGKIWHLGVTNFGVDALRRILEAGIRIISHQLQYSVVDRRRSTAWSTSAASARSACSATAHSLAGFSRSCNLGQPDPHPSFANRSLTKYRLMIDELGGWPLFQELLSTLDEIGGRHGVGPGTVALRYMLDKPQVAGLIVGARNAEHLIETVQALALTLDDQEIGRIERVLQSARGPRGDVYELERIKGGPHAAIMRYNLKTQ